VACAQREGLDTNVTWDGGGYGYADELGARRRVQAAGHLLGTEIFSAMGASCGRRSRGGRKGAQTGLVAVVELASEGFLGRGRTGDVGSADGGARVGVWDSMVCAKVPVTEAEDGEEVEGGAGGSRTAGAYIEQFGAHVMARVKQSANTVTQAAGAYIEQFAPLAINSSSPVRSDHNSSQPIRSCRNSIQPTTP
jgi:hypothetical protein